KNVFHNIALPLEYSKMSKNTIQKKVNKILSDLEIIDCKEKYPSMLSVGEAQRVSIARALIQEVELILADEPIDSLDEETVENVMNSSKRVEKSGQNRYCCDP